VWFVSSRGGEHYLSALAVPSAEVLAKSAEYAAANTPVLQSGDKVDLRVSVSAQSAPANLKQQLDEKFRGKIAAAGYQLGNQAAYRLQVELSEQDSGRQLEYRMFGMGSTPSTIQVPDRRLSCKVAFVDRGGQEIWQTSSTFGPAMTSFNRGGGDFTAHLLEARWQSLDRWIDGMQLAQQIRRYSSVGKYGTSRLSPTGEQILSIPSP
jgi:hypothetical protein